MAGEEGPSLLQRLFIGTVMDLTRVPGGQAKEEPPSGMDLFMASIVNQMQLDQKSLFVQFNARAEEEKPGAASQVVSGVTQKHFLEQLGLGAALGLREIFNIAPMPPGTPQEEDSHLIESVWNGTKKTVKWGIDKVKSHNANAAAATAAKAKADAIKAAEDHQKAQMADALQFRTSMADQAVRESNANKESAQYQAYASQQAAQTAVYMTHMANAYNNMIRGTGTQEADPNSSNPTPSNRDDAHGTVIDGEAK